MKVSELKTEMTARFAQSDARLDELAQDMNAVKARLQAVEQRIVEEGVITRRHFDIVAEQFKAEVRLTGRRRMKLCPSGMTAYWPMGLLVD